MANIYTLACMKMSLVILNLIKISKTLTFNNKQSILLKQLINFRLNHLRV